MPSDKPQKNAVLMKALPIVIIICLLAAVLLIDIVFPPLQDTQASSTSQISQEEASAILADLEMKQKTANPDLEAIILEFSDFGCPFCASMVAPVHKLRSEFGTGISFIFMQFPVEQLHPGASRAAAGAVCAREQGKFWEYHDHLFLGGSGIGASAVEQTANDIGLDMVAFRACLTSSGPEQVQADVELGKALGVQGTPTFFVIRDGQVKKVEGAVPYEQLRNAIVSP